MPSSDNITVPIVSEIIKIVSPESALDIGVGMGKFGFLFREAREWRPAYTNGLTRIKKDCWRGRLDGIEVCPSYITPLHNYLYDEIHIGLAQNIVPRLGFYDLIHMGDVIEHLSKPDGLELLNVIYDKAKIGILVVTPVGEYPQQGTLENPYEEHKSVWGPRDLAKFPWKLSLKAGGRQWVIFISKSKELLSNVRREKRRRALDSFHKRRLHYKMLLKRAKELLRTIHP
jgi:hypothetical protein